MTIYRSQTGSINRLEGQLYRGTCVCDCEGAECELLWPLVDNFDGLSQGPQWFSDPIGSTGWTGEGTRIQGDPSVEGLASWQVQDSEVRLWWGSTGGQPYENPGGNVASWMQKTQTGLGSDESNFGSGPTQARQRLNYAYVGQGPDLSATRQLHCNLGHDRGVLPGNIPFEIKARVYLFATGCSLVVEDTEFGGSGQIDLGFPDMGETDWWEFEFSQTAALGELPPPAFVTEPVMYYDVGFWFAGSLLGTIPNIAVTEWVQCYGNYVATNARAILDTALNPEASGISFAIRESDLSFTL